MRAAIGHTFGHIFGHTYGEFFIYGAIEAPAITQAAAAVIQSVTVSAAGAITPHTMAHMAVLASDRA